MVDNGTLCPLPWISISMNPHGTVRACGRSKAKLSPSLKHQDISSAWDSEYFQNLRNDMLAGVKNSNCANCYKQETLGGKSKRQEVLEEYNFDFVNNKQLIHYDIRVGNICNLKCVHCWTGNSSKWYEDKLLLDRYENTQNYKIDNNWITSNDIWDYLKENIDTIKKLNFLGGEPFASKQHNQFIDWCIENNKTNFILRYITNGTLIDPNTMDKISKFNLDIGISLDAFGERAEFLRFPNNWNTVKQNLDYINQCTNIEFAFFNWTCYNLNFYVLDEVLEYTNINFNNIAFRYSDYVTAPKHLSVQNLPIHFKEQIAKKLKHIKEAEFYINFMLEDHLWDEHKSTLYSYLTDLDAVRKTNWKKTLPEIAALYE